MPFRNIWRSMYLILKKFIPHNFTVRCSIDYTNCPSYDKVLWKVRNVGSDAEKRNDIRGEIKDRGKEITEHSKFSGPHYIECYLIRNGVCVAIGHIEVPIGAKLIEMIIGENNKNGEFTTNFIDINNKC
ncbi:hypothetical protein Q5M85_10360 [Paraclostridium bifermentans]|nr:hypothetical protein [Paraclostridium bifermentans]